jgi:hypothetical protein
MAETDEKKPFEDAVRAWRDLSGDMVHGFGRLAEAWIAANTELVTGVIRASADAAIDLSDSLSAVPSKRRDAAETGKTGVRLQLENRMDDMVNSADAVTHSVANGIERSAKVLNGAWDVFARHYHDKSTDTPTIVVTER